MSKEPELTKEDLVVGATYRGKRFVEGPFGGNNDRYILWMSDTKVQYDSDTVRDGANYPTVPIEKFLKWAKKRVEPVDGSQK